MSIRDRLAATVARCVGMPAQHATSSLASATASATRAQLRATLAGENHLATATAGATDTQPFCSRDATRDATDVARERALHEVERLLQAGLIDDSDAALARLRISGAADGFLLGEWVRLLALCAAARAGPHGGH